MSSSVARRNIRKIRLFVRDMVRRFVVSSRQTRVGIVQYSLRAQRIIKFTQVRSRQSIYRILGRIRRLGGRRYTGRALTYTKRYLFYGKPKCARKRVLIVIANGVSTDRVWKPAKSLNSVGVEIFAVLTRRQAIGQMRRITTTRHHLYVTSYSNLVGITDRLKNKICVTPKGILCL